MVDRVQADVARWPDRRWRMSRPVVQANVDRGTISVDGAELRRFEAVGLVSELTHALMAIWPREDPAWELDPTREGAEGRSRRRGT